MNIRLDISAGSRRVIERLNQAGYEAYLVGGAVRDLLLDIQPKDYDLATSATPSQVKQVFGRRARIIGRRFRLAHVYLCEELLEVSTFRRAPTLDERKGRDSDSGLMVWRDNEFGTLEQDAWRRDFTVNALYFDPLAKRDGIIDFVNGVRDMEERTVRAIGDPDVRVAEDPVRMLRACKLKGQYGFRLSSGLATAVAQRAPEIGLCSKVRLLEELFKVFMKPYCYGTLAACHEHGILQYFLPMLAKVWDTPQGEAHRLTLQARDNLLAAGRIYPSRVTGLASLILPYVHQRLGEGAYAELWENHQGVDDVMCDLTREFFHPYHIPKFMAARLCHVLLLQPRFLVAANRRRVKRHVQYNRGRDTFSVFVQAAALPEKLAKGWPERLPQPEARSEHEDEL